MPALLTKCPACKGAKKVMGMGMMGEVKCKTCDGIGFEKPISLQDPVVKTEAPKKAVSRKKK